ELLDDLHLRADDFPLRQNDAGHRVDGCVTPGSGKLFQLRTLHCAVSFLVSRSFTRHSQPGTPIRQVDFLCFSYGSKTRRFFLSRNPMIPSWQPTFCVSTNLLRTRAPHVRPQLDHPPEYRRPSEVRKSSKQNVDFFFFLRSAVKTALTQPT